MTREYVWDQNAFTVHPHIPVNAFYRTNLAILFIWKHVLPTGMYFDWHLKMNVFIISEYSMTLFRYCGLAPWKVLLISGIDKCNSKGVLCTDVKEQHVVHLLGLLVCFPKIVIIWYLLEEIERPQGNFLKNVPGNSNMIYMRWNSYSSTHATAVSWFPKGNFSFSVSIFLETCEYLN